MATLRSLVLKMLADIKDMRKKLDQYGQKIDNAKKATDKFAGGVKNSFKTFIKFGAIIGGAYLAVRKLTNFIKGSLDAYGKQEEAVTKLNAALQATGRYTPELTEQMQLFAKEMQDVTTFGDEVTIAAQGILATFTKIGNETFPEAIEAAMNMSTMFGQDLQQSVIQLGTALNDPIQGVGRLRRIGISFTEEQKALIETLVEQNDIYGAQRVILDELQVEIGGTARAVGDTYVGKMAQAKSATSDLKEEIGDLIDDGLSPLVESYTKATKSLEGFLERINENKKAWLLYQKALKTGEEERTREEIEALVKQKEHQIEINNNLLHTAMKQLEATNGVGRAAAMARNRIANLTEASTRLEMELAELEDQLVVVVEEEVKAADAADEEEDAIIDLTEAVKNLKWAWEEGVDLYDEIEDKATRAATTYQTLIDRYDAMTESIKDMRWEWEETVDFYEEEINKIDELKGKYDEWADKAEETMGKITGLTSMGVNAINGLQSQLFKNREIEIDNWYEKQKDSIYANIEDEEERERALEELDHEADQRKRQLARDEAKASKSIAIMNAIINTASAVTKALSQGGFIFGPFMAAFIGAMGAAKIAAIKAQPLPALAEGADFVTQGPQLVMVGDNPGGQERVTVEPLSSPNINGPRTIIAAPLILQIETGPIYEGLLVASENGIALMNKDALVE